MRYDGETWSYMGRRGFTEEGTLDIITDVDKDDVPFILLSNGMTMFIRK